MLLSPRGLIPTPQFPQMKVGKNMKANAEAYFQTVKIQVSLANLTLINVGTDI